MSSYRFSTENGYDAGGNAAAVAQEQHNGSCMGVAAP